MKHFKFDNLTEAWEQVNEMFINDDPRLMTKGESFKLTNASFSYDLSLEIEHPQLDPEFNFGKYFHYTTGKWSKLLNNYINLDSLDIIRDQIRAMEKDKVKTRYYTVGFHFVDDHENGKGCLLSGVFSRVLYSDTPQITIFIRAAEVTSRLPFDFLFFQRLGEYVYGKIPFKLFIHIKQAWSDDNIQLMYHNHRKIKRVLKGCTDEKRKTHVMKALDKMLNGKEEDFIKYQAHFRTFKTLHPEIYTKASKTKTLLAKDCVIGDWEGIPLPKHCPNVADRDLIKKHILKMKEKFNLDLTRGTQDEEDVKKVKIFSMKKAEDSPQLNEEEFEDELDIS